MRGFCGRCFMSERVTIMLQLDEGIVIGFIVKMQSHITLLMHGIVLKLACLKAILLNVKYDVNRCVFIALSMYHLLYLNCKCLSYILIVVFLNQPRVIM